MRPRQEGARRDRERECAAQHGQLAVDGRALRALALSPGDVPADVRRRDRGHASPAEERRVQPHVALHVHERPLPVHPVVVQDLQDGGAERQADELRGDDRAGGGYARESFQARFGHVLRLRAGRLADRTGSTRLGRDRVVLQPVDPAASVDRAHDGAACGDSRRASPGPSAGDMAGLSQSFSPPIAARKRRGALSAAAPSA